MTTVVPVIEGWFTIDEPPALLGRHCTQCGTYQFPPTAEWCPNPACTSENLETVALSRTGTVWSYTDARYQPPAPFVSRTEPYEPFAIAAVELEREGIVVLGQVADGFGVGDLRIGTPVEVVVEPLDPPLRDRVDAESTKLVWRWRPVQPDERPIHPDERTGR
jgi:uncharacterized OB-fold protein